MNHSDIQNKIFEGESDKILKYFNNNIIDLVITSPPYDNLRNYKDCNWTLVKFKLIANELYRVLKPGGVVVWIVGDACIKQSESGSSFKQCLYFKEIGFKLHDTMIYKKNTSSFPARRTSNRYTQIFEYMFVLSKNKSPKTAKLICDKKNKWAGHTNWGKKTHRNKNGDLIQTKNIKPVPDFSPRNNIWSYVVGNKFNTNDNIAHNHPAIFPEKLVEDHVLSWSNENDLILDIFNGSGTTMKVAHLLKRHVVGIERNETYNIEIALPRLKQYMSEITIIKFDDISSFINKNKFNELLNLCVFETDDIFKNNKIILTSILCTFHSILNLNTNIKKCFDVHDVVNNYTCYDYSSLTYKKEHFINKWIHILTNIYIAQNKLINYDKKIIKQKIKQKIKTKYVNYLELIIKFNNKKSIILL